MAVYVTVVLLTMLLLITAVFFTTSSSAKAQIKTAINIKQAYEAGNSKAAEIYDSVVNNMKPEYVSDGLILHYDAINNTGSGHDNTTTTWKDLSGNGNDLMLSNFNNTSSSGWNENSLVFDGIDDFGTISTIAGLFQDNITIQTRVYSQQYNNYRGISGNHMGTSYGVSGILAQYQDGLMRIGYNGNIVDLDYSLVTNKDVTLTVLMGTSFGTKVYINGELAGELHVDSNKIQPATDFWIGKSFNTIDRYFLGKMNNFIIYDRILTDDEIQQNYKADLSNYQS